jgi:Fe-S-cluster containining protein
LFVNLKTIDNLYFSNCDNCTESCCSAPKVSIAPLILEDFKEVYKNFAIQFAYINDEFKAQMIINIGDGNCKYLVDNRCIIYNDRAPVCHMYPMSPYYQDFYIDTACPAITTDSSKGEWICNSEGFSSNFYHKRVENFLQKLGDTKRFLNLIEDDIEPSVMIQGIQLYRYVGALKNEYIDMYNESLKHMDN